MSKEIIGFFAFLLTMMSISSSPYPIMLIIAYLIHELGHIFFASLVGLKLKKFNAKVLHLSMSYNFTKITYGKEMLVCLGGIIFNLISALLMWMISGFLGEACRFFMVCNISMALMNLYPATILDGAGALRAFLHIKLNQGLAEKISDTVSVISIFLMWILSVYLQLVFVSNLSLFIISALLMIELCFSYAKL